MFSKVAFLVGNSAFLFRLLNSADVFGVFRMLVFDVVAEILVRRCPRAVGRAQWPPPRRGKPVCRSVVPLANLRWSLESTAAAAGAAPSLDGFLLPIPEGAPLRGWTWHDEICEHRGR